jgi:hypothetical protein
MWHILGWSGTEVRLSSAVASQEINLLRIMGADGTDFQDGVAITVQRVGLERHVGAL